MFRPSGGRSPRHGRPIGPMCGWVGWGVDCSPRPVAHRLDKPHRAIPWHGCSPAEPASISPGDRHATLRRESDSTVFWSAGGGPGPLRACSRARRGWVATRRPHLLEHISAHCVDGCDAHPPGSTRAMTAARMCWGRLAQRSMTRARAGSVPAPGTHPEQSELAGAFSACPVAFPLWGVARRKSPVFTPLFSCCVFAVSVRCISRPLGANPVGVAIHLSREPLHCNGSRHWLALLLAGAFRECPHPDRNRPPYPRWGRGDNRRN